MHQSTKVSDSIELAFHIFSYLFLRITSQDLLNFFFFFFLNSEGYFLFLTASPFTRVVAYLSRVLESAFTALEGLNKQAFLAELV